MALWIHYPISIGLERALTAKTKWDCIFAGRHPDVEDVIREGNIGHKNDIGDKGMDKINASTSHEVNSKGKMQNETADNESSSL